MGDSYNDPTHKDYEICIKIPTSEIQSFKTYYTGDADLVEHDPTVLDTNIGNISPGLKYNKDLVLALEQGQNTFIEGAIEANKKIFDRFTYIKDGVERVL